MSKMKEISDYVGDRFDSFDVMSLKELLRDCDAADALELVIHDIVRDVIKDCDPMVLYVSESWLFAILKERICEHSDELSITDSLDDLEKSKCVLVFYYQEFKSKKIEMDLKKIGKKQVKTYYNHQREMFLELWTSADLA